MPGQITSLSTEDPQVALIVAAHNAAADAQVAGAGEPVSGYVAAFTRIYRELSDAVELDRDADSEEDDDFEDDDDEDDHDDDDDDEDD